MSTELELEVSPMPGRHMTAEEYFQMPEGPPYFQLIDGQLFTSPSALYYHQKLSMELSTLMYSYIRAHKLGDLIAAPSDVQLDEQNVFQPDLYFIRKDRLSMVDRRGFKGAPDLVVEILSPSTRRLDLGSKKQAYTRRGVEEYWIVSPERREIQVYRLQENADVVIYNDRATITTPVLPGFALELKELFV